MRRRRCTPRAFQFSLRSVDLSGMGATAQPDSKRLLLVWDMPNIGISGTGVIRTQPKSTESLTVVELSAWLRRRAFIRGLNPSATIFMNVAAPQVPGLGRRAETLVAAGFAVHAQPVGAAGDDVDDVMVGHVKAAVAHGNVAEVIVASHDRLAFAPLLADLAGRGIATSILGYAKCASWVEAWPAVSFVDLRAVADWARVSRPAADSGDRISAAHPRPEHAAI